jgi:hypothetical protein
MRGIANEIFRRRFPVALDNRAARRTRQLDTAGNVGPEIDVKRRIPQIIFQGWRLGIQTSENEAPVALDLRNLN